MYVLISRMYCLMNMTILSKTLVALFRFSRKGFGGLLEPVATTIEFEQVTLLRLAGSGRGLIPPRANATNTVSRSKQYVHRRSVVQVI